MISIGFITLCFIVLSVWSVCQNVYNKWAKYPPGPYQLPIIGHLHYMLPAVVDGSKLKAALKMNSDVLDKYLTWKPAYIVMDELSQQHGPLTALQFGVNHAIIVSSSEYSREILCREEFSDRFADGWFLERQFGKPLGLIFNNGKPYRHLKSFTLKHLKDFGLGRRENMEIAVEDELLNFLDYFKRKVESQNNVVHIHHTFTLPVLNILWEMVAGIRFSYDDKKLHQLIRITEEISRTHDLGGNILMAFPWLRFVAPDLTGHTHQMKLYDELKQFFWDLLRERTEEEFIYQDGPRDFVDVFVTEMRKQNKSNNNSLNLLTEEQFVMVCLDLFTAGSETTANTLEFALLYAMLHPRVQNNVQKEIDDVIGPQRLPTMSDRQRMPYTQATLIEAQRMCNVIPLVHRVATKKTKLGPYQIKKDDVMVINMHSVHKDEKVWGDPHTFRPERFLDESGNLTNLVHFMPFGMGKRVCVGEVLAKHTLFTYFTSVLQRYSFHVPPEREAPKLRPVVKGFTISPDPYTALVKPRHQL